MAITDRDKEILSWINRHGFATCQQVQDYFGMSRVMAYRRLQITRTAGLLRHSRILSGGGGAYC